MGVDLASRGKYSYGPRFVLKAALLSVRNEVHNCTFHAKRGPPHHPLLSIQNNIHNCTFHAKRGPRTTTPCFRYETRSITVLSTRSEVHPHHTLLSVRNEIHNCTFHAKQGLPHPKYS